MHVQESESGRVVWEVQLNFPITSIEKRSAQDPIKNPSDAEGTSWKYENARETLFARNFSEKSRCVNSIQRWADSKWKGKLRMVKRKMVITLDDIQTPFARRFNFSESK